MTIDRPLYILIDQWQNVYWPIFENLYCLTLFFIRHYKLLHCILNLIPYTYIYIINDQLIDAKLRVDSIVLVLLRLTSIHFVRKHLVNKT